MRKMTIKGYIINYAKDRYYFHISDLREYFAKKGTAFGRKEIIKYQENKKSRSSTLLNTQNIRCDTRISNKVSL